MAELELRASDGTTERRELSRTQPVSIGRQTFNDISVPDDDVGTLHCRIGWNKTAYELTAAVKEGVDVNGKLVQHVVLKAGDVIRVGSLDLKFRDSRREEKEPVKESSKEKPRRSEPEKKRPEPAESSSKRDRKQVEVPPADSEPSLFEGPVIAESLAEMLVDEVSTKSKPEESEEFSNLMVARNLSEGEAIPNEREGGRRGRSGPSAMTADLKRTFRSVMAANRVRPGEQDIFKSPLVLGLGGSGLLVLLVTATVWFLMGRQVAEQQFAAAESELTSGNYEPAIERFEAFITDYPRHSRNAEAKVNVGRAKILREIAGSTPSWKRGLEQLEEFIETHRNDADFKALQPALVEFSEKIALGAVKTAEQIKDPELLATVVDATRRMEQFSDPANPPDVSLEQIRVGVEAANAAIRKQKTIDEASAAIDKAFRDQQPITVLKERAKLLQTYPDLATTKRIRDAQLKAVELEKSIVKIEELDQPAATTVPMIDSSRIIVPIEHTRTRTDETASGRLVYAVARDGLYALDVVTGEATWRQVIGSPAPFFPVLTTGAQPGILIGETSPPGLTLRNAETGALIWRQTLPGAVSGAPLVHASEIFIAGRNRKLYRLDLDTGRFKEQATFSQEVVGPPMVTPDAEHLLIAGDAALIYSLSIRPLKVTAVTFTDHAAGAVSIPLIAMGKLALLCDNDRLESCKLRIWPTDQPGETLAEANSVRIEGRVIDRPVLRGSQLVVVSTGERLQAFSVSDEPEKKGIASIGNYRIQDGYGGPMQLALGPDQQFWLASSAFRRFQVSNDSIRADPNSTAIGIAAQPLQIIGEQFFVARHPLYSQAVVFTQVDRERMAGSWRAVLGGKLLAWTEARTGGIIGVSDAGTVFLLSTARLDQGGLELKSGVSLDVPTEVTEPLGATRLTDGRIAAWCGAAAPRLWFVNAVGQIESEHKLDTPLDAAPILVRNSLVLPQPGRLKWHAGSRDAKVQDFVAPIADGETARWAFLIPLDNDGFVAVDRDGQLLRLQIREDDVVHLAEAARSKLPQPIDLTPSLYQGDLWLADAAGTVRRLDSRSFDVKAERTFDDPVVGIWGDEMATYVQTQDGALHALSDDDALTDRWSAALGTLWVAAVPLAQNNKLTVLTRQGVVLELDTMTGQEIGREQLPQPLTLGPLPVGGKMFAGAEDGTIYRLEPPKAQP